jgi:nitrous oxide reductase accessory protein NosL
MKKIAIVLFVAATALAACGKKKDAAAPTTPPAAGSGDMGSAAPMGSGDAPAGGSAAM